MMTSMTDRELPTIAGAIACPFVAFEGGRDSRATSPDHRHRCYAEVRPTPRALAHQQAYCLSSAFAVCPTFQDWARREAAQAQPAPELAPQVPTVHGVAPTDSSVSQANAGAAGSHRNPRRDWASPPPWMGSSPRSTDELDDNADDWPDAQPILPREGGLSGSFADRILAGPSSAGPSSGAVPPRTTSAHQEPPTSPEVTSLRPSSHEDDEDNDGRNKREAEQPMTSRRPRVSQRGTGERAAPSWERTPRREAYPTLKTRMGLSGVSMPPILLGIVALVIATVGVFVLPTILGIGNPPQGSAGPSPSAVASDGIASATPTEPTAIPGPKAQIYVVQAGDTMSRIANRFGVPLQALVDANKATIPNADRLDIGQQVIIPATAPTTVPDAGASPSPAASASP